MFLLVSFGQFKSENVIKDLSVGKQIID